MGNFQFQSHIAVEAYTVGVFIY